METLFPKTPTLRCTAIYCLIGIPIGLISLSIIFIVLYQYFNAPPVNFPLHTDIEIQEGLSHRAIIDSLKDKGIIRSSFLLYSILIKDFNKSFIQAGTYRFETPLTTYEIANGITKGLNKSPLLSITLPEGFMARDLLSYLPHLKISTSTEALQKYEGYLFPDTYFLSSDMTLGSIITLLRDTADDKLSRYDDVFLSSKFTRNEIIILASIIEREAQDLESKKIVSGILQNRLEITMPLQVDACFDYILDKTSAELTPEDLEIDSPYNTYTHTGLPPTPIANPGIEAIEAVLYPKKTDYLYYLTGSDGNFYYAKTFEEHKRNKIRYLR